MDPLNLASILDALSTFGALGAAGLVIFGLLTERIIPRARLDEMRNDRREGVQHAREMTGKIDQMAEALARLEEAVEDLNRSLRRPAR